MGCRLLRGWKAVFVTIVADMGLRFKTLACDMDVGLLVLHLVSLICHYDIWFIDNQPLGFLKL